MELDLRFIEGTEIKLTLKEEMTVGKVKEIAGEAVYLEGEISLIFKGRILDDNEIINKIPGIEKTYIIVHNKRPKRIHEHEFLDHDFPSFMSRFTTILGLNKDTVEDPPNFNELVNSLIEMGFEKSDCERALRISGYVPDSAATLLLSGGLGHFGRLGFDREETLNTENNDIIQEMPEISSDSNTDNEAERYRFGAEYDEEEDVSDLESEDEIIVSNFMREMIGDNIYSSDSDRSESDNNTDEDMINRRVTVNIPHLDLVRDNISIPPQQPQQ